MTNAASQCSCVVDTDGLYCIAKASGNLKTLLLDHLKSGVIAVPVCAWQEFEKLYEDEAESLKPCIATRLTMKKAYHVGAASIADKLDSGFPRGIHDTNVELFTAAIASSNGYRVLTSSAQVAVYERMECEASDLESWVDEISETNPDAK